MHADPRLVWLLAYLGAWLLAGTLYSIIRRGRGGRVEFNPLMLMVRVSSGLGRLEGVRRVKALRVVFTMGILALGYGAFEFYRIALTHLLQRLRAPEVTPPFTPILPGLTISIETFFYLLPGLSLAIVVHELGHALAARLEGVRVRSVGLAAILALIIGAFVELDESDFKRCRLLGKVRVYAAGILMNFLTALILLAPFTAMLSEGTAPAIVYVEKSSPAERAGLRPGMVVVAVNGTSLINKPLSVVFKPEEYAALEVTYVVTVYDPEVHGFRNITVVKPPGRKYIGLHLVFIPYSLKDLPPHMALALSQVLYFAILINYGVAVVNAAPMFITDGAKVLDEIMHKLAGGTGALMSKALQVLTLLLLVLNLNLGMLG